MMMPGYISRSLIGAAPNPLEEVQRLREEVDTLKRQMGRLLDDDTVSPVMTGVIKARHIRSGLAADLPANDQGRAGDIYYATDTSTLYAHNGAAWDSFTESLAGIDFLVGTATGALSGEIVAGTAPGGELGGTWASPTVDATHSGSVHVTAHSALTEVGGYDHLAYTDVQLTNAQILALAGTPITLVGDPGANKAVIVWLVWLYIDRNASQPYTETADNLVVEYTGSTDIMTIETTGFVDTIFDEGRIVRPAYDPATPFKPVANLSVRILNNGGEFGGGDASQTMSIRTYYSIVDMGPFT